MKTILVTGTKGKTTVVHLLEYLFRGMSYPTISIDSNGSHINGIQKTTYEDSINVYGRAPNVAPGRYLYGAFRDGLLKKNKTIVILEAGISCGEKGTELEQEHEVGIFTNVLTNEISRGNVVVKKKSFIFNDLKPNGYFIYNADDEFITKLVHESSREDIVLLPVSKKLKTIQKQKLRFNIETYAICNNQEVRIYKRDLLVFKINGNNLPYTFNGTYLPMLYNLAFSFLALIAVNPYFQKEELINLLKKYKIPESYGRYVQLKVDNKHVILDYAHEIKSQKVILNLFKNSKITFVTRVGYTLQDKEIEEYAKNLAQLKLHKLIIYDKVDGENLNKYVGRTRTRETGESSEILLKRLGETHPKYTFEVIINEQHALKHAIDSASKDEVIIHVQNNIEKTMKMLRNNYKIRPKT